MTKKQINALQRIIDRERASGRVKRPGVHTIQDRGVSKLFVTDGAVAIVFKDENTAELPEITTPADALFTMIRNEKEHKDYTLNLSVTTELLKEWKALQKEWKKCSTDTQRRNYLVEIRSQEFPHKFGHFNPCLLVDAVEAIGIRANIFIGQASPHYCALFVFPKNFMELGDYDYGYILPYREMRE